MTIPKSTTLRVLLYPFLIASLLAAIVIAMMHHGAHKRRH